MMPLVLPFFCIVDSRKSLHREVCERREGPFEFLETRIPYSSIVEQMGLRRAPVPTYAASSDVTRSYESLWTEIQHQDGMFS